MKVVLNCSFGDNVAGDVVDLKKDQAQNLINSGFARMPKGDVEVTSDSQAIVELKALRDEHAKVVAELDTVKEELALVTVERDALATQGANDGKASPAKK